MTKTSHCPLNPLKEGTFLLQHKPTRRWVKIQKDLTCPELEIYGERLTLKLDPTESEATMYLNEKTLKEELFGAEFLNTKKYGFHNFLEFQVIEKPAPTS